MDRHTQRKTNEKMKEARQWHKERIHRLKAGTHIAQITSHRHAIEYSIVGDHRWNHKYPTILILHGGLGGIDQSIAIANAQQLPHQCNVIVVSRPGYLQTNFALGGLAISEAVSMIALLDYLDVKRVSIQGFSAGAIVALYMALITPSRVEKLILISIGHRQQHADNSSSTVATNIVSNNTHNSNNGSNHRTTSPYHEPDMLALLRLILPADPTASLHSQQFSTMKMMPSPESQLIQDIHHLAAQIRQGTLNVSSTGSSTTNDNVNQRIREMSNYFIRQDHAFESAIDILSLRLYRRTTHKFEKVWNNLCQLDTAYNNNNDDNVYRNSTKLPADLIRYHHVLDNKPLLESATHFILSMLPPHERILGFICDLVNLVSFWPAALEDSSNEKDAAAATLTTTSSSAPSSINRQVTSCANHMRFPWDSVKTPTLIIQSSDDSLGDMNQAYRVASLLPNAHVYQVPNAGHLVWLSPSLKKWRKQVKQFLLGHISISEMKEQYRAKIDQLQLHHQPQYSINTTHDGIPIPSQAQI